MRQRSLSVMLAAATGLAMTGLMSSPASASVVHRADASPAAAKTASETADSGDFRTAAWDRTTAEIEESSFVNAITSWDSSFGGTAIALQAGPDDDRPGRPINTRVWAGGTGAAADARTVNSSESTEETAPSRRPASQFA